MDKTDFELAREVIAQRDKLQSQVEHLQAEKNELTYTLLATIAAKDVIVSQLRAEIEQYSIREGKLLRDNARLRETFESIDSSNWLAEQKAQWRREVLLTASAELNRSVEWDQVEHRWLADWERVRRMAEQPDALRKPA